jgi:type IV pilus assembly protein PilC
MTAVAEAPSRSDLLGQLKTQGLTVLEVKELKEQQQVPAAVQRDGRVPFSRKVFSRRVTTAELAVFWREFATMVAAGLPIIDALEAIAQELEHVKLRKVLNRIIAYMWEGFNFSQSIRKYPQIFSPMIVALIGAAEESGSLAEVSNQLATYLENRDRLLRKVQAALTYPIFLVSFFFIVMVVATFWIIPKFREIYSGFGATLPWLTTLVFDINAFILAHLPWLIAGSAAALTALVLWARTRSGRLVLDRVVLKLPIFGKLMQRASVARLCRSLSILLTGGIPINRALEMAQDTAGNSVVAKAIKESREEILKGAKIAPSLKKHDIFPHMAIRMVSAGEETGSLSSLLLKVSDFYEQRVDAALTTINTLIEPVMIVIVGCFVLIFVLSMYLPIFSLAATMRG